MNWVDVFILVTLIFFALDGAKKGFLIEILDFLSFLVAFFISFRFYDFTAFFLNQNFAVALSLSKVLGFLITWFLSETIFIAICHILILKTEKPLRFSQKLNSISFIPAILRGFVFICLLLLLLGTFPIQPRIKAAITEAKFGSLILDKTQRFETPIKNIFGGFSQDTLTFLTIKPKSGDRVDLGFKTDKFKENLNLESEMVELVNNERLKLGLNILKEDNFLKEVGRMHSRDMFLRGYFSHFSPENEDVAERADKLKVRYLIIGENLAYAPSLDLAHTGLMNSPGHRANILGKDFNRVGIGIMDGGVYGLMVTQVFAD